MITPCEPPISILCKRFRIFSTLQPRSHCLALPKKGGLALLHRPHFYIFFQNLRRISSSPAPPHHHYFWKLVMHDLGRLSIKGHLRRRFPWLRQTIPGFCHSLKVFCSKEMHFMCVFGDQRSWF